MSPWAVMPADAWAVIFARFGSKEAAEAKEAPKAEAKAPASSAPAAGDFRLMPADAWAAIFARFEAKEAKEAPKEALKEAADGIEEAPKDEEAGGQGEKVLEKEEAHVLYQ